MINNKKVTLVLSIALTNNLKYDNVVYMLDVCNNENNCDKCIRQVTCQSLFDTLIESEKLLC